MFHLSRLGIDFAETMKDSSRGDLWLRLPDGRLCTAEVKAGYGAQWQVRRAQLEQADVFFFVRMDTGRVYIAPRDTVAEIVAASKQRGDKVAVTMAQLTIDAELRWNAIGVHEPTLRVPVPVPKTKMKSVRRAYARTVKRVLSDGTTKVYHYPADDRYA